MLEGQSIVSSKCLEVFRCEIGSQYAGSVPLRDEAVVEGRSGMAQGEQRLGVAILLQENIVDGWKSILQIPKGIDVRADPLSDLENGPRILDDSPQLHSDDLVDDGIDQPNSPAEPIEDSRLAHVGGSGDFLERRREPPITEDSNRRTPDPVDVSASIRA